MLYGRVESFDDHRGDGLIRTENGDGYYFHCVNIVDGSRRVELNQGVSARRGVGHLGRDEALEVVKESD